MSNEPLPSKKIRVGIIGFGLAGKTIHSGLLKSRTDYEVVAVSSSRVVEVKGAFPKAQVFQNAEDLIKSENVDLVINTTPNTEHFKLSKLALECGKHVVVEKPFVTSVIEGEQLIQIAKANRKILSVFHNRRWDADFLTVKKLIEKGALGNIFQFESRFDRFRPTLKDNAWRERLEEGSGIWYDLGAHLVDQALVLFGMPESLAADIGVQRKDAVTDDYFHVTLHYDRMRVMLYGSCFAPNTPRFQVFGDRASFVKFGLDPQEKSLLTGLAPSDSEFGIEDEKYSGEFTIGNAGESEKIQSEAGTWKSYYDGLSDAIRTGSSDKFVDASDALNVIRVIKAAQRSSEQGVLIEWKDFPAEGS